MIENRWINRDRARRACDGESPNLCSFGGGSQTETTTQAPYLATAAQTAGNTAVDIQQQLDGFSWPQLFPGATTGSEVSPFTAAQTAGLTSLEANAANPTPATDSSLDFANTLESGGFLYGNPANPTLSAFANGDYANPMSNPEAASTIQQLESQAIPGVVSQFVSSGNMNNPDMAYAASQGATNAIAPYLSNLYTTGQTNQLNAAGTEGSIFDQGVQSGTQGLAIAPQTASLPFIAPQEEFQAGSAQQSQNQNLLNSEIQAQQTEATMPEQMTSWLAQIADGAPGGTMSQPLYTNTAANVMGGVSGGLSMLSTLGTLVAAY
jgi:hypothetical protein